MADGLVEKLRRKYRIQKTNRSGVEQVWDEIDYYTGPVKEEGAQAGHPSNAGGSNPEQRKDLWDHTAIDSREKLAASIHGSVTPNSVRWFAFGARTPELNRDNECAKWLGDETDATWNDLQDSDFYVEIACTFHELSGPGHAFLGMEPIEPTYDERADPVWEGADFTAIPLRDCYFEQDRKGKVKTFWRTLMWEASQVMDHCEERGIPVPEDVAAAYEKGDSRKFEFVYCVFQRPKIMKRKKLVYPAAPDKRPWGCVYFRNDGNGAQFGEEGGFYEQTIFMCRWSRTAGSKWGHGPGNQALPTVKYVNGWKELMRTAGEKAVDPSLMAEERNILSNPDLRSKGITIVRKMDGLKPLESGAKFPVGELIVKEDQQAIRHLFHTDELELKDSPAMTATEAQIRYEWMNRLLGKTLAFMQSDLLGPVLLNHLAMRVRTGAARPMPDKLRKAGGLLNIEYQGPLARSQRTDEVAAIERGATFVAGLAQFYPEVRAALDPIEAVKLVFSRLGVPASVMPPDNVLRQRAQEYVSAQRQAVQADANMKNAKAAKDAAASAPGGNGQQTVFPSLPPRPPMDLSGRTVP